MKWHPVPDKTFAEAQAIAADLGELALGVVPHRAGWAVRFWDSNRAVVLVKLEPERAEALGAAAHIEGRLRYRITRRPRGVQGIDLARRLGTATEA